MVKVSDAELEILKVIWDKKEVTSNVIIKEVEEFNWSSNTVRTLIRRLQAKGAIETVSKNGKSYVYIPLYDKEKYRREATKKLLKQLYNNSASDLLLALCREGVLKAQDLKNILQEMEQK